MKGIPQGRYMKEFRQETVKLVTEEGLSWGRSLRLSPRIKYGQAISPSHLDYGGYALAEGGRSKKYIENDEHLVDLKVRAENQDHITILPATAIVRLVSRT